MSYCRFENTSYDLDDCIEAIYKHYDENKEISDSEAESLAELLEQAKEIVDLSEKIELILAKKNEE